MIKSVLPNLAVMVSSSRWGSASVSGDSGFREKFIDLWTKVIYDSDRDCRRFGDLSRVIYLLTIICTPLNKYYELMLYFVLLFYCHCTTFFTKEIILSVKNSTIFFHTHNDPWIYNIFCFSFLNKLIYRNTKIAINLLLNYSRYLYIFLEYSLLQA